MDSTLTAGLRHARRALIAGALLAAICDTGKRPFRGHC
jgi:hypothetical protein